MSLKRASVGTLRSKTVSSSKFSSDRLSLRRFPFPSAPSVAAVVNYIEDVFSTYLFSGVTGGTQTITNEIDLSGKGGLVWNKLRSGADNHYLVDSARGTSKYLITNDTAAEATQAQFITAFNNNGFSFGTSGYATGTVASWTFRKQAKFFDVVTYTGNGIAGRTVAHTLGSVPGCMIVKQTNGAGGWSVYHRSIPITQILELQTTGSAYTYDQWNSTQPTSTNFTVSADSQVNGNGNTYVAYLFAHDAGGFGLSGTDNVISCGTFATTGAGGPSAINLGYEPQWVILKPSDSTGSWTILDNMRGWVGGTTGDSSRLFANLSNAESAASLNFRITSTGFTNTTGITNYIYIAIRRGPMKTPTSGTSVFKPVRRTGNGSTTIISAGFPIDASFTDTSAGTYLLLDRLRSGTNYFRTISTDAEAVGGAGYDTQDGYRVGTGGTFSFNTSSTSYSDHFFRRAPGFFDIVSYTGTSSAATFNHNLTAVPELMIVKRRDSAGGWIVYFSGWSDGRRLVLQSDSALISADSNIWNNTGPTSTQFTVGSSLSDGSATYINYLFASCSGVSKVGSYTGNGSSQTIDCGFSAGARYILIKRTDSTGDWTIFDSALGIVDGNEDFGRFNSPGGVSGTVADHIDPTSVGFIVNQVASSNINVNNATYIFLAIA